MRTSRRTFLAGASATALIGAEGRAFGQKKHRADYRHGRGGDGAGTAATTNCARAVSNLHMHDIRYAWRAIARKPFAGVVIGRLRSASAPRRACSR